MKKIITTYIAEFRVRDEEKRNYGKKFESFEEAKLYLKTIADKIPGKNIYSFTINSSAYAAIVPSEETTEGK